MEPHSIQRLLKPWRHTSKGHHSDRKYFSPFSKRHTFNPYNAKFPFVYLTQQLIFFFFYFNKTAMAVLVQPPIMHKLTNKKNIKSLTDVLFIYFPTSRCTCKFCQHFPQANQNVGQKIRPRQICLTRILCTVLLLLLFFFVNDIIFTQNKIPYLCNPCTPDFLMWTLLTLNLDEPIISKGMMCGQIWKTNCQTV